MGEIQQCWKDGFLDGWKSQGALAMRNRKHDRRKQLLIKTVKGGGRAAWLICKWSAVAIWGFALTVAWIVLLFVDMGFSDEGGCSVVYLRNNNNQGGSCDWN